VELESFEGFASSTGQIDVVSLALERRSDHGAHRGLVINHENPHGLACYLLSAESGHGVRRLRICEPRSQTPASILFAHLLPLLRLVQPQRYYPAEMHCSVTEPMPFCERERPHAACAVCLHLR